MIKDTEFINAFRHDTESGFRLVMNYFREPVYWHIRRLVINHADAQDATQQTFIRVFRSLARFRGDSPLKVWIYRIATNEALRQIEKRCDRSLHMDDLESPAIREITAEEYVDFEEVEAVKLQNAILSLPAKQQLTFNLRYYDEMGYDEIAKITDSTMASAKANYHVAKRKIIKYMNE